MKVLFGFDTGHAKVVEVLWEEDGEVMTRMLRSDGSIKDDSTGIYGLASALVELGGAYSPMYPAEVDDLRSAFQYLGKAADLVETLPEASLGNESSGATA